MANLRLERESHAYNCMEHQSANGTLRRKYEHLLISEAKNTNLD